jgi:hypothetical protein
LHAASFEADQAAQVLPDPGVVVVVVVVVVPIVAVHGAQVPWGKVFTDGVPVVPAKRTFRNLDQGDRACASAVPGSRL